MTTKVQLSAVLTGLLATGAIGLLVLLLRLPAGVAVERRLPSSGGVVRGAGVSTSAPTPDKPVAAAKVDIKGVFQTFSGRPGKPGASWPGFRGANLDNVVSDSIRLADQWAEAGPPVLWSIGLSEGHGGAAVWKGVLYLLDYDEKVEGDSLRAFSVDDGSEIWRRTYHAPTKRNHGVSRTVPAVNDRFIVTMGPRCHVLCVDRSSGDFLWGMDLVNEQGSEVPLWYTGQCPLFEGETVVLAPGGKALMMGVDCSTGKILWQTPNPDGWKMSHSSIMPMKLLGRRMYVYCAMGGVVGVSAEPEDRGKLLWKSAAWTQSVMSPSPVGIDDTRVFLTAGYGGGSMMLGLKKEGDAIVAEPLFKLPKTVFSCEQHTPILTGDHLYGILPKDAAALKGQFACLKLNGELAWTSGMTERFGLGPFLVADGKIFILNDNGELTLARLSDKGFEKLARARVLNGRDAWGPMALVDGRLILRDSERMICLDVRAGNIAKGPSVSMVR